MNVGKVYGKKPLQMAYADSGQGFRSRGGQARDTRPGWKRTRTVTCASVQSNKGQGGALSSMREVGSHK